MTRQELEERLNRLGTEWPLPSVAEGVMSRIESIPMTPRQRSYRKQWQAAMFAVAAALLLAFWLPWFLVLVTPRALQSQVRDDLKNTSGAHITISALDEKGVRRKAEVWYSRDHGFRLESHEGIIVDNGTHQWSWQTGQDDTLVSRRASRDAVRMIADMFRLDNAPVDWSHARADEHDREIGGKPCQAYVVTPPPSSVLSEDGSRFVPDPNPLRIIVWTDPDKRIVRLEDQRQVKGQWQPGREIDIAYDVAVDAEKFTADFPASARVIDADRALDDRFPLAKALAKTEVGGLLFAVHEAVRVEDGMLYIVSSVRGTPEHLKQHPPKPRRMNLQTTVLDVAEQPAAPGTDGEFHRLTLASAESDGVHYLWWMAAQRKYFRLQGGVRVPESESPSLEVQAGRLHVPLTANYRGALAGGPWVTTKAEIALPANAALESIAAIAARARRDALLIQQGAGPISALHGAVINNQMRYVQPDQLTDAEYAREVSQQLEWLRSHDEVQAAPAGTLPPGIPRESN